MNQDFKKKLKKYKKNFDPIFLKYIPKTPQSLWQPVFYHFKAGGKRWRPFLVRLVAELYKVPLFISEPLEVIVELTHNWTLIHDDIEDEGFFRRGKITVWRKFGLDYGVNSGDAIFALSFKILREGERVWGKENTLFLLERLSETLLGMAEGQNLEFDFRKKKGNIKISEYIEMVKKKTSLLPKFGLLGIAKIAKIAQKEIKALENFCDNIFPAFQIRDDILNLIGKKEYGKEIGGDIKEGKRTIPIIHLLNNISQKEKKEVLKILLKRKEETKKKEVKKIINLMKKKGSLEFADLFSQKLLKKGKESLSSFSNLPEKKILEKISDWLVKARRF